MTLLVLLMQVCLLLRAQDYLINFTTSGAASKNVYGGLYNWFAATDSRNPCPAGWHVPTNSDRTALVN